MLEFLHEVWTPPDAEFLPRWLNEDLTSSKLTDDEKRLIDGNTVLGIFSGCVCVPDGFSDNDRYYPMECFFDESGKPISRNILEAIKAKNWFGSFGHEDKRIDDADIRAQKHAFVTYKYDYDPKLKLGMARHLILGTDTGWAMYAPMKAGSEFKMSSRAQGEFKEGQMKQNRDGKHVPIVNPSTFDLYNFDSVLVPGFTQTSAVLQEKKQELQTPIIVIENKKNRSVDMSGISDPNYQTHVSLNEALKENIDLKVANSKLTESAKSLQEQLQEKASKVLLLESIGDSGMRILTSFLPSDFDMLFSTKVSLLGESKTISFNKNGFQSDSVFVPINIPVITEARLRQSVYANKALFESFPSDVAVVTKKSNPEFGGNGLVLSWALGSRPANVNESVKKFIKASGLFEADQGDYCDDDAEGDCTTNEKKKKLKEGCADDELTPDDKEELTEWRAVTKGTKPSVFLSQVMAMKEALNQYVTAFGDFATLQATHEQLQTVAHTHEALGSTDQVAKWKYFFEYVSEQLGDPEKVMTELAEARKMYTYIQENYGSIAQIDEAIANATKKLKEAIEKESPKGDDPDVVDSNDSNDEKMAKLRAMRKDEAKSKKKIKEADDEFEDDGDLEDTDGDSEMEFDNETKKKKIKESKKKIKEADDEEDSEDETDSEDDSDEEDSTNEACKSKKKIKEADEGTYDGSTEEPNPEETLTESAKRISKGITLSFNETLQILKNYKGDVNEANQKVFKHLKKSALNENKVPVATSNDIDLEGQYVKRSTPVYAGGSLLNNYYDSMELRK